MDNDSQDGPARAFWFRLNQNRALDSCFDAFAQRERASTSLGKALADKTVA